MTKKKPYRNGLVATGEYGGIRLRYTLHGFTPEHIEKFNRALLKVVETVEKNHNESHI